MEYAKIKRVFAKNFMAHKESEVFFEENSILNFCGENASGKTAFTMILEILGYNAYNKDQSKFIKEGTSSYTIGVEFEDGIIITQTRYRSRPAGEGKVLWEAKQNGRLLYSNTTSDGKILIVEGVPDAETFSIKDCMGMVVDEATGEQLNVRRRNNKLLFIDTTGGDNYKIFNSILGCDQLRKASKELSDKYNRLHQESKATTVQYTTLTDTLSQIDVLPEGVLSELETTVTQYSNLLEQYQDSNKLRVAESNISALQEEVTIELSTITKEQMEEVFELAKLHNEIKGYKEKIVPEVCIVDTAQLRSLEVMYDYVTRMTSEEVAEEIEIIGVEQYGDVRRLVETYNQYVTAKKEKKAIEEEYTKVKEELKVLAESTGYKVCQNCGTIVM